VPLVSRLVGVIVGSYHSTLLEKLLELLQALEGKTTTPVRKMSRMSLRPRRAGKGATKMKQAPRRTTGRAGAAQDVPNLKDIPNVGLTIGDDLCPLAIRRNPNESWLFVGLKRTGLDSLRKLKGNYGICPSHQRTDCH
jgi:hypothetical protein